LQRRLNMNVKHAKFLCANLDASTFIMSKIRLGFQEAVFSKSVRNCESM